jgi:hypothetical protein
MIGENPIVTKDVLVPVERSMTMLNINFINFKRKLQMKTIATLIATLVTTLAFATEPAKPVGPAAPAATPAATAPAATPAKKEEMKLAKKEGAKQDSTKSTKPVKDKKATAKAEPAKTAVPATK